jgi:RNA polymerase sigma-70 factor (ECF subfamily)
MAEASAEFVGALMRSQRRLYAFIFSLTRNTSDAEDVFQETNLVLWEKSVDFQPGTDFTAWSFRIARFQILAFRKKRVRSREHLDDGLIALLADEALEHLREFDERHEALGHCLDELRPELRSLIAQRYQPGGCVNDIAQDIGRTPKAVSELLRRTRQSLLQCIERKLALEQQ